jgi:hypothetical protein
VIPEGNLLNADGEAYNWQAQEKRKIENRYLELLRQVRQQSE